MAVTIMKSIKQILMMAKRLLSKIPPFREKVWMKQAITDAATAMPRTAPFVTSVLDASRTRTPKLMAFPAMLPRMIKEMPNRDAMKSKVSGRYAGFR